MSEQETVERIQTELKALKSKHEALDKKYRYTWHSGTRTFDILDEIESARKRKVELEDALRVMEEFK